MMIEVKELKKAYGDRILFEKLSFSVGGGERICLTGRSGKGKTTLLRILLGLETPDRGEVSVTPKRAGVLFQEDRLVETMSGLENLLLVGNQGGREQILQMAKQVDLAKNRMLCPVSLLSGGERRRVALLRAFYYGEELIVLDEPFAGLDAKTKEHVKSFILKTIGDRALIVTDHDGGEFLTDGAVEGFRELSLLST